MDTVLIKASALGYTNVVRYVLERASQVGANVQNRASDMTGEYWSDMSAPIYGLYTVKLF